MSKLIRIRLIDSEPRSFTIVEQTRRGEDFGESGRRFAASNGIVLWSSCRPEASDPILYVRGDMASHDDDKVTAETDRVMSMYISAIVEYNEMFMDPRSPWDFTKKSIIAAAGRPLPGPTAGTDHPRRVPVETKTCQCCGRTRCDGVLWSYTLCASCERAISSMPSIG